MNETTSTNGAHTHIHTHSQECGLVTSLFLYDLLVCAYVCVYACHSLMLFHLYGTVYTYKQMYYNDNDACMLAVERDVELMSTDVTY